MKSIKYFLLLLFVFATYYSCQRDKLVREYYLSEEMKAKIPYKGYETIIFKSDSNQLIELKADAIHDTINRTYSGEYSDYDLWEYCYIYFSNQTYKMIFNLNDYLVPKGIGFWFVYLDSNYRWGGHFRVFHPASPTTFLDSLLINGSLMHDIYFDTLTYLDNQPYPHELQVIPVKSYYSTTLGIVKVDFSDGSTWELKEVIW